MAKILLLGSGGREHALAWKIAQSPKCEKLYIAPGNAGTANCGENVAMKADDFEAIKAFIVDNNVDMVVVGASLICYGYACFDEFHQLFVNGRTGQFSDCLIDTSGAILGILLFKVILIIKKQTI